MKQGKKSSFIFTKTTITQNLILYSIKQCFLKLLIKIGVDLDPFL